MAIIGFRVSFTAQGAAGNIAGELVGSGLANVLRKNGLMTPFFEFVRQTASGMSNATVNQAIGYAAADKKPTGQELAEGLVPSFLFIFAFAPSIDWLASRPRLAAALEGVTAAVVGVIATLALWFGAQVLFGGHTVALGPLRLPDPAALDWRAALIAVAAGVALLRFHAGLLPVLAASALAGLVLAG